MARSKIFHAMVLIRLAWLPVRQTGSRRGCHYISRSAGQVLCRLRVGQDDRRRGHSMANEVTIRIGGESGEGTISGGDILALASARWGYHVYTFRTFPAEILGGPCLFQVRISDEPVKSMGDYADVLVCLNQEAYDRNISDLRPGGVLVYDPSDFTPDESDHIIYAVPFNEIARKQVQLFQTKNMVMLGAISGLF